MTDAIDEVPFIALPGMAAEPLSRRRSTNVSISPHSQPPNTGATLQHAGGGLLWFQRIVLNREKCLSPGGQPYPR